MDKEHESSVNEATDKGLIYSSGGTVLTFSMFFTGISGICYEYNFSKLASDILGNYARQWAIIIGLMMFFMGIGADLQRHFKDRWMVTHFLTMEVLLGLAGGAGPTIILFAYGWFHDHFILIHYFLISFVGLLIGLEIPLLTRINELYTSSLKHNIGRMLRMDYIGSFAGALIWIFIFPRFFSVLEAGFLLGAINIGVALFTWIWFRKLAPYGKTFLFFSICTLLLLGMGFLFGEKLTLTAEQKLYRDRIVFTQTTPYQHIVITEQHSGDFNLYINGHLQFSSVDEHIYHEFLTHPILAAAENKKNVLVLGGGDGLAVREILKYPDVEKITLVDIDPEMTRIAKTEPRLVSLNNNSLNHSRTYVPESVLGVFPGDKITLDMKGHGFFREKKAVDNIKVHILNLDALEFLKSVSGIYDIIIIDFPDPNSRELSKLYSLEFYSHLKKKLSFNGLIIQQSTSPAFAKEAYLIIGRTLKAAGWTALPIHHNVPSFGDWGWWIAGKSERYSESNLKSKITSVHNLEGSTRYITDKLIANSFDFGKNGISSKNKDINRLLNGRIFDYYRIAWERIE